MLNKLQPDDSHSKRGQQNSNAKMSQGEMII